jgi:F-type H+-transporting ATPase subunit delta
MKSPKSGLCAGSARDERFGCGAQERMVSGPRPTARGPPRRSERPHFSSAIKAFRQSRALRLAALQTTPDGTHVADDSRATDVSARYAQALFDLALEENRLDAVEAELTSLQGLLAQSADLKRLLASPRFTAEDKAKGLAAVAERAGFSALTTKFLGLLVHNRRTAALVSVIGAFRRLAADWRGQVSAQVTTAIAMNDAQMTMLASALRHALGKDPQIEAKIDPAILGGVKVRVGSRLYDASLKSRLDSLKYALKRA